MLPSFRGRLWSQLILEIALSISASDAGVTSEVAMPDPDHFRALLLPMRPFVLQKESHAFRQSSNISSVRLDRTAFRTYLDRRRPFLLASVSKR